MGHNLQQWHSLSSPDCSQTFTLERKLLIPLGDRGETFKKVMELNNKIKQSPFLVTFLWILFRQLLMLSSCLFALSIDTSFWPSAIKAIGAIPELHQSWPADRKRKFLLSAAASCCQPRWRTLVWTHTLKGGKCQAARPCISYPLPPLVSANVSPVHPSPSQWQIPFFLEFTVSTSSELSLTWEVPGSTWIHSEQDFDFSPPATQQ